MELKKGYKQTEIGVIPDDWEIVNFEEVADSNIKWSITGGPFGSNLKTSDYTNEGIRIIQLQNIGDGEFINKEKVYTSVEKANELLSANIYPNEIILSKMGDPVARACFIPSNNTNRYLMASDGIRLVVNEAKFDKKFIHDYINSIYFRKRAFEVSLGSTRLRIGLPNLKSLKVIHPPLEEQKAIAQVLTDIDQLIKNLKTLIGKKRVIKQGVMQELLTGKKRLKGFSNKWEECNIGSLCKTFTKQTGFDYSNHIKPTLIKRRKKGVIPFIQNKDFDGKKINFNTDYYIPSSIANRFPMILLDEKCFLISISGSIGKVGVFSNSEIAFIGGAVAVGKFIDNSKLDWVMFYLMSDAGQNKLLKNMKAGSHQNLILDDIRKITIPMPTNKEQKAIVQILSDMDSEIEALETQLQKTENLKQGMMQELLTGKIRLVKPLSQTTKKICLLI